MAAARAGTEKTTESGLAAHVRTALKGAGTVREVTMFGGVGFMLNGNLLAGASRRGLLLRVGKERQGAALQRAGARPMVMRGRTLDGYVFIDPRALTARTVRGWLGLALPYVRALPAKPAQRRKSARGKPMRRKAARRAK